MKNDKKLLDKKEKLVSPIAAEDMSDYGGQTKQEILNSFDQALKELKLYKEGKLKTKPLEDLLNEL